MVWTLDELRAEREKIIEIAKRHGAKDIRVFGSVARGESSSGSDVDFLVAFEDGRSLFDLGGFIADAEELLQCKVDVVSERGLRPRFREHVLQEAVPI